MHLAIFSALVAVGVVALAAWAVWFVAVDRPVVLRQLFVAGGLEVVLLAQTGVLLVGLAQGHTPQTAATGWGYLLTSVVLMPLAAFWSIAERSRWSSVVLVAAALAVGVVQWRLVQVWGS